MSWSFALQLAAVVSPVTALLGVLWYLSARLTRQDVLLQHLVKTVEPIAAMRDRISTLEGRMAGRAEVLEAVEEITARMRRGKD